MTVLSPSPDLRNGPLSVAMREGSRREHGDAESSRFVVALLEGRVDEAGYAQYLARLRDVYAAIESVGRAGAEDPLVAAVLDPALERLPALEEDLAFWSGGSTLEADSPATERYVERVHACAEWGGLFLAHHYTRYLGDLSGGQAIGRFLAREFGLERGGRGVRFYEFPQVPKPKPYKDAYRAALDGLGLDDGQQARVVEEVRVAFRLNQDLFIELDERLGRHERVPLQR